MKDRLVSEITEEHLLAIIEQFLKPLITPELSRGLSYWEKVPQVHFVMFSTWFVFPFLVLNGGIVRPVELLLRTWSGLWWPRPV